MKAIEKLFFNPPSNTYNKGDLIQVIYIKNIPCLFLPFKSPKYTILFHGNSEDIFTCKASASLLRKVTESTVIIVEYPSYSLYKENSIEASKIKADSLTVYDYLVTQQNIPKSNILVVGRSIGTGPATYLAAERNVRKLCLVSPFTSIKEVANYHVKYIGRMVVSDFFDNLSLVSKITSSTLIIHGKNDDVIPYNNSETLIKAFQKSYLLTDKESLEPKLETLEENDHNNFDWGTVGNYINKYFSEQEIEKIDCDKIEQSIIKDAKSDPTKTIR